MTIALYYSSILVLFLGTGLILALHELSHATVGRLLGGGPMQVYIGSYGDVAGNFCLPLGRTSRLYVRRNPLRWRGGLCRPSQALYGYRGMLMILAGPVLPAAIVLGLVWWAFHTAPNAFFQMWSMTLVPGAVFSMLLNLRRNPQQVLLADGSSTHVDGTQLWVLWAYRHVPASYLQAIAAFEKQDYAGAACGFMPHLDRKQLHIYTQEHTVRWAVSALSLNKDFQQALQVLDKYRQCLPVLSADLVSEGIMRVRAGDVAGAFQCFEQGLQLDPTNILGFANRGYTHLRENHYEAAIADFRQAVTLQPDNAYSHANLGLALLMLGQTDEGFGHMRHALQLNDSDAYAHRNLGIYHLRRGELAEAGQHFDQAGKLDPDTDLLDDYRAQLRQQLA